jgi:hypothetical protein
MIFKSLTSGSKAQQAVYTLSYMACTCWMRYALSSPTCSPCISAYLSTSSFIPFPPSFLPRALQLNSSKFLSARRCHRSTVSLQRFCRKSFRSCSYKILQSYRETGPNHQNCPITLPSRGNGRTTWSAYPSDGFISKVLTSITLRKS